MIWRTFLWRKEKYQKKHCPAAWPSASLARTLFPARTETRLKPVSEIDFRTIYCFPLGCLSPEYGAQTVCPLFPKKPPALGGATTGRGNLDFIKLQSLISKKHRPSGRMFYQLLSTVLFCRFFPIAQDCFLGPTTSKY